MSHALTCTNASYLGSGTCGRPAVDYREPTLGNSPAFACSTCRHEMSMPAAMWHSLDRATPAQLRNWHRAVKQHHAKAQRTAMHRSMSEGSRPYTWGGTATRETCPTCTVGIVNSVKSRYAENQSELYCRTCRTYLADKKSMKKVTEGSRLYTWDATKTGRWTRELMRDYLPKPKRREFTCQMHGIVGCSDCLASKLGGGGQNEGPMKKVTETGPPYSEFTRPRMRRDPYDPESDLIPRPKPGENCVCGEPSITMERPDKCKRCLGVVPKQWGESYASYPEPSLKCKCEHYSHFMGWQNPPPIRAWARMAARPRADDHFKGPQGHSYGYANSEVHPNRKTEYGNFNVCADCIRDGHMGIHESYAPPAAGLKCECEHHSHFTDDDFKGQEGHPYGRADSEVHPKRKTECGHFNVCTDCIQDGHMGVHEAAEPYRPCYRCGAATRNRQYNRPTCQDCETDNCTVVGKVIHPPVHEGDRMPKMSDPPTITIGALEAGLRVRKPPFIRKYWHVNAKGERIPISPEEAERRVGHSKSTPEYRRIVSKKMSDPPTITIGALEAGLRATIKKKVDEAKVGPECEGDGFVNEGIRTAVDALFDGALVHDVVEGTVADLRKTHKGHFFDPGTMRFFKSRLSRETHEGPGGTHFVTSERRPAWGGGLNKRHYRIRRFDAGSDSIKGAGEFLGYKSGRQAHAAAQRLAGTAPKRRVGETVSVRNVNFNVRTVHEPTTGRISAGGAWEAPIDWERRGHPQPRTTSGAARWAALARRKPQDT